MTSVAEVTWNPCRGRVAPGLARKAEYPFQPITTSTLVATPFATASAAFCREATGLTPPMCTVTEYRRSSMPRLAASSSADVKPAGGMRPSTSAMSNPASATAVPAASSMSSTGVRSAPRT